MEINGILIFKNTANITLQAHYIWVREGTLKIGSELIPYLQSANIILHGDENDFRMVIDSNTSGNKILAVTGRLELYGS